MGSYGTLLSTLRSFVRRRAHVRNGSNAALSTVLPRAGCGAVGPDSGTQAELGGTSAADLTPPGSKGYISISLVYRQKDQRLRLCSCADGFADPIPDCSTNGHADRQRCALASSHAAGLRNLRVPWLLQARSRRSPSRRPRARRGRGAARRARRMDARSPRRATRAKQFQKAPRSCSSARCQRHWATCGASAG